MNNIRVINKAEITPKGFLMDNKHFHEYDSSDLLLTKNVFYLMNYKTINYNNVVEIINDKTKINKICLEINNYNESCEFLKNLKNDCEFISGFVLIKFGEIKKNIINEPTNNSTIKFISKQDEVLKYNDQLIEKWNNDYYIELKKHWPIAVVEREQNSQKEMLNKYSRYIALKNGSPVAELGFVDIDNMIFLQKFRAMSAWMDKSIANDERKYIWSNLFSNIKSEGMLSASVASYNTKSINFFLKNDFKINHILISALNHRK